MSPEPARIVGVSLVRNEDRFLARALANASAFCDRFLLFDHGSRDGSANILAEFSASRGGVEARRVAHPRESHEALGGFAGRRVWVFGVDGDEIYDPAGLAVLRRRLLGGEFDDAWMLMGHCLHADEIAADGSRSSGFLAPPSRSITKLYNFAAVESWGGRSVERLHGGRPVFRSGFHAGSKRLLHDESDWEDSPLRCLHACFCRRSSLDSARPRPRANIDEIFNSRLPAFVRRALGALVPGAVRGSWKPARYRRGLRVTVDTGAFFP